MQFHRPIRYRARAILALLIPLALAACNSSANISEATHAIGLFHFELDQANYAEIWKTTSPEMRAATPEPDLTKLFVAIHKKLGKVVQSDQLGAGINYNTSGTFITITMHTRFDHGTGDEQFVYKSGDSGVKLRGYHLNSNDMMSL